MPDKHLDSSREKRGDNAGSQIDAQSLDRDAADISGDSGGTMRRLIEYAGWSIIRGHHI